ncbi:unnamed protein product [Pleuronectes platessa]|uniref:Uncharacterized protein n=1 Tax=Pleuronectes platessa TaxID=8262 RepID=A0A9N7V1M8_PLEPL|nr:unnamed protein product [Pleuronectes platessa]
MADECPTDPDAAVSKPPHVTCSVGVGAWQRRRVELEDGGTQGRVEEEERAWKKGGGGGSLLPLSVHLHISSVVPLELFSRYFLPQSEDLGVKAFDLSQALPKHDSQLQYAPERGEEIVSEDSITV